MEASIADTSQQIHRVSRRIHSPGDRCAYGYFPRALRAAFGQSAASSPDQNLPRLFRYRTDQHSGLTVSVDPYTEAARTKDKFGKANPHDVGVLPIEVFLRNDSDQPMRVNLETVQLEVTLKNGVRQEVDWLRAEEVAQLIAHPTGAANPQQKRIPLPLPMKIGDKKVEKLAEVLRPLSLDADVIPPKAHDSRIFVFRCEP